MPYIFEAVEIIIFDVHTVARPIFNPALLKENFRFLVDEAKYNEKFIQREVTEAEGYIIHPIKNKELSWGRFWQNYRKFDLTINNNDFYKLQIPFVFKPKGFDLSISADSFKAEISPVIYLFTTGWSSNLRLMLTGSISGEKLQNYIGQLKNDQPFLISGEKCGISTVFEKLRNMLMKEIYNSPEEIDDKIAIPNYFFISLQKTASPPKFFDQTQANFSEKNYPLMSLAEKAELFSILYGKEITTSDFNLYSEKTTRTVFMNTNIGLTNFDNRSLFFMQEIACSPNPKIRKLRCFISNVRFCAVLTYMFRRFQSRFNSPQFTEGNAPENLKILLKRIDFLVNDYIRIAYENAYCRTLIPKKK